MDVNMLDKILKEHFYSQFKLHERQNNLFQLFAPFYHTDGDMVDIFIRINSHDSDFIEVCDCGITLMRLSYEYEIDTSNKKNILESILLEHNAVLNNGNITLHTRPALLFATIMQMSQIIAKVSNMKILQRDSITSLFYEMVNNCVFSNLNDYNPVTDYNPLQNRDELTVDYAFNVPNKKPIFLFPVKSPEKAKTAVISMLFFQQAKIPFVGTVVYDNFDNLPQKERKMILSAADKHFYDFDDFAKKSVDFFSRTLVS